MAKIKGLKHPFRDSLMVLAGLITLYFNWKFFRNLYQPDFFEIDTWIAVFVSAITLTLFEAFLWQEAVYRGSALLYSIATGVAIVSILGSLGVFESGVFKNTISSSLYQLKSRLADEQLHSAESWRKSAEDPRAHLWANKKGDESLNEAKRLANEVNDMTKTEVTGAGNALFNSIGQTLGISSGTAARWINRYMALIFEVMFLTLIVLKAKDEKENHSPTPQNLDTNQIGEQIGASIMQYFDNHPMPKNGKTEPAAKQEIGFRGSSNQIPERAEDDQQKPEPEKEYVYVNMGPDIEYARAEKFKQAQERFENFKRLLREHPGQKQEWYAEQLNCDRTLISKMLKAIRNDKQWPLDNESLKIFFDQKTNLTWQYSGSEKMVNFENARKYIFDLNLGFYQGSNDWRLPTLEEVETLDFNDHNSKQNWIWTSTKKDDLHIWARNLKSKSNYFYYWNDRFFVKAVHG